MNQKLYDVVDIETGKVLNTVVLKDPKLVTPDPGTKLKPHEPKKLVERFEPDSIDELQFIDLLQDFGGASAEQIISLYESQNPTIKLFFIKARAKRAFSLQEQFVLSAIDTLYDEGYIPNGKRSIFDNWPDLVHLDAV